MEVIIAGALVTLLVQFGKWVLKKTQNKEVTKAVILVSAAILALGAALVYQHTPQEVIEAWAKTWLIAIGFFEGVYKLVIQPALSKITK